MGRNHARVLSGLTGVRLVVGVDPVVDAPAELSIPTVKSVGEAIGFDLDMAVVAAPTSLHAEIGHQLASASVHTLIEKPLATSALDAFDLARAFASRGVVGCVGHIERYNPAIREIRTRFMEGAVGDLLQISTRRVGYIDRSRVPDVGVVLDLASHDIDLAMWVSGRRYSNIDARLKYLAGTDGCEDLAVLLGQLSSGVITSHFVSRASPFKERLLTLTGDCGVLQADTVSSSVTWIRRSSVIGMDEYPLDWPRTPISREDRAVYLSTDPEPLWVELDNFRRAVLGEDASIVSMFEGASVVQTAECALQSGSRNR